MNNDNQTSSVTCCEKTRSNVEGIIKTILENLVENSNAIKISNDTKDGFTHIYIKVDQGDMGRVIGHSGSRIQAIRLLASAIGSSSNMKIKLTLVE